MPSRVSFARVRATLLGRGARGRPGLRGHGEAAVLEDRADGGHVGGAEAEVDGPAIRPYPVQYVSPWTAKNGMQVLLRPIGPEDEPAMVKFHETLSDRSVYMRFAHMQKLSSRVAHERLITKCFIDYDREMALVA